MKIGLVNCSREMKRKPDWLVLGCSLKQLMRVGDSPTIFLLYGLAIVLI